VAVIEDVDSRVVSFIDIVKHQAECHKPHHNHVKRRHNQHSLSSLSKEVYSIGFNDGWSDAEAASVRDDGEEGWQGRDRTAQWERSHWHPTIWSWFLKYPVDESHDRNVISATQCFILPQIDREVLNHNSRISSHFSWLPVRLSFGSVADRQNIDCIMRFCLTLLWTVQPALHHVPTFCDIDRWTISQQLNIPWNRANLCDTNSSIVGTNSSQFGERPSTRTPPAIAQPIRCSSRTIWFCHCDESNAWTSQLTIHAKREVVATPNEGLLRKHTDLSHIAILQPVECANCSHWTWKSDW
jgi:hypothetical protein